MKLLKLNSGNTIPPIGYGTWKIVLNGRAKRAVLEALKAGYRLIDTARIYGNEKGVGAAIRESGIPRGDIFLTTKLWNWDQGYDRAFQAFDASCKRLDVDYLDLYLIHRPSSDRRRESWDALQEIYKNGRAKSIGVSNYRVEHLQELLAGSDLLPAVNQIEFHPFVYKEQVPIVEFCHDKGIVVEAYSPFARGDAIDDPTINSIAERVSKTPAQVMLRWAIQHGTVPIPKSSNPKRMRQNLQVFDFELPNGVMRTLNNLG
jgi:methylglyoxal/glyoxal reductase